MALFCFSKGISKQTQHEFRQLNTKSFAELDMERYWDRYLWWQLNWQIQQWDIWNDVGTFAMFDLGINSLILKRMSLLSHQAHFNPCLYLANTILICLFHKILSTFLFENSIMLYLYNRAGKLANFERFINNKRTTKKHAMFSSLKQTTRQCTWWEWNKMAASRLFSITTHAFSYVIPFSCRKQL